MLFLCPECGGTLLFVIAAGDTYRVDPRTGEFRWFGSDGDTYFKCYRCGARFEPVDNPELPFEYKPNGFCAVAKEAQPV